MCLLEVMSREGGAREGKGWKVFRTEGGHGVYYDAEGFEVLGGEQSGVPFEAGRWYQAKKRNFDPFGEGAGFHVFLSREAAEEYATKWVIVGGLFIGQVEYKEGFRWGITLVRWTNGLGTEPVLRKEPDTVVARRMRRVEGTMEPVPGR